MNLVYYNGGRTALIVITAISGSAPKIFAKCTKRGIPLYAVMAVCAFSLLSFLNVDRSSTVVFNWFVNIVSDPAPVSTQRRDNFPLRPQSAASSTGSLLASHTSDSGRVLQLKEFPAISCPSKGTSSRMLLTIPSE